MIYFPVSPFCRPGQQNIYSIGRQETIKIPCELEANPTDITFTWKFNTSNTETLDIPINQISNDRARSVVEYSPMTSHVNYFYIFYSRFKL